MYGISILYIGLLITISGILVSLVDYGVMAKFVCLQFRVLEQPLESRIAHYSFDSSQDVSQTMLLFVGFCFDPWIIIILDPWIVIFIIILLFFPAMREMQGNAQTLVKWM